jgi:hypothetical protein
LHCQWCMLLTAGFGGIDAMPGMQSLQRPRRSPPPAGKPLPYDSISMNALMRVICSSVGGSR